MFAGGGPDIVEGGTWPNQLALYRETGGERFLAAARRGADAYLQERIDAPATDFNARQTRFWLTTDGLVGGHKIGTRMEMDFQTLPGAGDQRTTSPANPALRRAFVEQAAARGGFEVDFDRAGAGEPGLLDEAGARNHPKRSELYSALGTQGSDLQISVSQTPWPLAGREALMLCTDGLWEWVPDGEIAAIAAR